MLLKSRCADIAGQDAALEQLRNVVELPLRHRSYFEALRVAPQSSRLVLTRNCRNTDPIARSASSVVVPSLIDVSRLMVASRPVA
jgi:hypothetical protein